MTILHSGENRENWRTWRFDQIAVNVNDRIDNPSEADVEHYVGLEHLDTGSLKIRRWGSPSDVEATKLRFRKGDVIFGRRRVYQRKVAVAEFDGICSAHAMVLRAKPEVVLPEYLPFFMQSDVFMSRALEISVGSLSPTINWTKLATQEFVLPPLKDQLRIVELMHCSNKTTWQTQLAIESLRRLRTSSLEDLCFRAHRCVTLGDVCYMQNGRGFPGTDYSRSGYIRLLRPGNLGEDGYLNWHPEKTVFLPTKYEEIAKEYVIRPGDVVINLTAQSLEDGFMGRVCLARDGDFSLLNQRIGRLVFSTNQVHPQYVFRVLQTQRFQRHTVSMCEGSKVKHLYWRHLERFEIPLPSIEEQQAIVDSLIAIDSALNCLIGRHSQQVRLRARLLNQILGPVQIV